ncbi:MAG TPA: tRNA epoxyqueuosine(34) reductase QueG [Anaerolineales bacterium]|nr:tRNA epoxyqueuosine(34) reductase QueG [Anaerolineales bacterium]
MSLEARLKAEARRLGFALAGITTPEPPPHLDVYQTWLQKGRQGEMGYLATERAQQRRANPRLILPECRSILVLATPYNRPLTGTRPDPPDGDLAGRTAAYAWGDDYHDVLPARMQALVAFLRREVGHEIPHRWYTDTGPLLERELAQRAGLGWIGKNTCLINPAAGSTFFLSEILLGLELKPDPPFNPDMCGTCTRCIEACPTQCILDDRTLDARRCISYLTIELKTAIPVELRSQMGNWVFGCDVCQQVCPWNIRFAPGQGDPAFAPRPQAEKPNLLVDLQLSPQDFNQRFRGSPVKRAKRRGYLRNIATALGNAKAPQAAAQLASALQTEPEALARRHVAWALGQIGGAAAQRALSQALLDETDPEVRREIEQALRACSDPTGGTSLSADASSPASGRP